jgi:predicted HAD superfamily Cof-like phosphohydrolase
MREELEEVEEAMHEGDIKNIAKELSDLLYVVFGTAEVYGLGDKMDEVFAEVHRSNMSKLDKNGKAIKREDGKVLKSDLYTPANFDEIL